MKWPKFFKKNNHIAGVVYQSQKGAILGPGSGITNAEQAKAVIKQLRGQK